MIIISVSSPVGGSGKTSTAIAIASSLHELGRKVLLVQIDPSNLLAFQLGLNEVFKQGFAQMVLNGLTADQIATHAPAGFQVIGFGQCTPDELGTIVSRMHLEPDLLTRIVQASQFPEDLIMIVDAPRWPNILTNQILANSDLNLLMLVPDSNSILGTEMLLGDLLKSRGASYFLMNRFESSHVLHLDLWTMCKMKLSHRLLPFYMHEDQSLPESFAAGVPMKDYAPSSQLVEDFQKLCNWIDAEIG